MVRERRRRYLTTKDFNRLPKEKVPRRHDQSGNVVGIVTATMSTVVQATKTGTIPENINFAIKTSVARIFMDANGVTYRLAPSDKQLSNAEIGDRARKFTGFVSCTS
jgi:uncharacterized protein